MQAIFVHESKLQYLILTNPQKYDKSLSIPTFNINKQPKKREPNPHLLLKNSSGNSNRGVNAVFSSAQWRRHIRITRSADSNYFKSMAIDRFIDATSTFSLNSACGNDQLADCSTSSCLHLYLVSLLHLLLNCSVQYLWSGVKHW